MLCLDDSVDGPRLPFLRAQVASMLWALGFWIWEGATGDFTMAPTTSARRHGAPTTRTCLLRRLLLLRGEKGATSPPGAASPPLHRIAAVSCIAYRVTQQKPSPGPDLSLSQQHRRRHQHHFASFPSPPCAAALLPCRVLTVATSLLFFSRPHDSDSSRLIPHLSCLIFHISPPPLTHQFSVLSPRFSCLTFYQATPPPPKILHQPYTHDEALPFVLARAGPIRVWRRLCAPS